MLALSDQSIAALQQLVERAKSGDAQTIERLRELMQPIFAEARRIMDAISRWLAEVWPAMVAAVRDALRAVQYSDEFAYRAGVPHQRHVAWRRLKRVGIRLPNPARPIRC